jgi:hypothetical protein
MKTRKVLQLPALIVPLALAAAPRSQAVIYTWNTDTTTAFDVVISGTGLWSSTTFRSPSGLWAVGAHVWMASDAPSPGWCTIANGGDSTTFLGPINGFAQPPEPYEIIQGYADDFHESTPIHDGASFENGNFPKNFWTGSALITITSMPNASDVSTWTWTDEVSGQMLVVPEPGTLSLGLVGFGFLAARRFARQCLARA